MSDEPRIDSVNKHYLDKVMDLAETMGVETTEDIFDARGMKLIGKGARISRAVQEKLILHKLRKPFESSISVEGGINSNTINAEARRIIETVAPVACIFKASYDTGVSPLDIMARLQFGNAMSMMLTIIEKGGAKALEHSVMVSLVSVCFAKKLGLNEKDQQVIALAGLLHDIGELYIEPEYLHSQKRLLPHEWRHVIVHPRIGQMLIQELENYPPAVALAVAEHHERFDGTGYPRQVCGKNISIAGQAVSVAEMISGVFMKRDRPLDRAELALKIIPGEHAHNLVSVVSNAMRVRDQDQSDDSSAPPEEASLLARSLFGCISSMLQMGDALTTQPVLASHGAHELLSQALKRIRSIQRAFISTGLDVYLSDDIGFLDTRNSEILFEAAVATKEIQWRLRDVARDVALHTSALEAHESDAFKPLITMLDQAH